MLILSGGFGRGKNTAAAGIAQANELANDAKDLGFDYGLIYITANTDNENEVATEVKGCTPYLYREVWVCGSMCNREMVTLITNTREANIPIRDHTVEGSELAKFLSLTALTQQARRK